MWGGPPAWSTLFSASSGDYSCIETFQHVATASKGGIKVLLWRGGVKAERYGVKDGRAVISVEVSSITITPLGTPTKKTDGVNRDSSYQVQQPTYQHTVTHM